MFWTKNLKVRIILSTIICILIVGLFSNLYLYFYMNSIITEKSDSIDKLNLQTVQSSLNEKLLNFSTLGNLCSNDLYVARGITNKNLDTVAAKQEVLNTQKTLQNYLSAIPIEQYINRLLTFNEEGITVQTSTRKYSTLQDANLVMAHPAYKELIDHNLTSLITIGSSIIDKKETLIYISKVFEHPHAIHRGFLYMEMDTSWVTDTFSPYQEYSLFLTGSSKVPFPRGSGGLPDDFLSHHLNDREYLNYQQSTYRIMSLPLQAADLSLYSKTDATFLTDNRKPIFFTTIVIILSSLTAAIMLAVLLSNIITKPLQKLRARLVKISEKDFSCDPEIEKDRSEIGQMGKIVNHMTANINRLLDETEQMHIQQKNAEIALLQSQINPHFLYNTLDSVRWMAVIQKNPGIEKTVRSLSNLLKNLSKGIGDKITLEEELKLLQDYVDTQSVRFMQMFEMENHIDPALYHYRIVKFTLQPLVENSIFHGIEPSGNCGSIFLNAHLDGDYLIITIEDNGVGMTEDELIKMKESFHHPHPKGMASIGVTNVHHRLKLTYGNECGVFFESEKNKFTRVTVKIRKELADVSL